MEKQKGFVVITGCDSGLGEAFCRIFLEKGYRVIASYLKPPGSLGERHYPLVLDQREEESVHSFAKEVMKLTETGGIDTLILNAGIVKYGPVGDLPLSYYREVMEVNLFGTVRIVQALLDRCIESRSRILIHSSLAGRVALPFFSPYTSSKFALEGFGESLRREVAALGVEVCLLDSGGIATPIWNKGRKEDLSFLSPLYRSVLLRASEKMISGGNRGLDVTTAARRVFRLTRRRLPANYILSKSILGPMLPHLPRRLLDRLIRVQFGIRYDGKQ